MKWHFWLVSAALLITHSFGCSEQKTAQTPANEQLVGSQQSQQQAGREQAIAPEDTPGLEVGSQAPDFTLKDQSGTTRSLSSLLRKGPVALVFYRSADW